MLNQLILLHEQPTIICRFRRDHNCHWPLTLCSEHHCNSCSGWVRISNWLGWFVLVILWYPLKGLGLGLGLGFIIFSNLLFGWSFFWGSRIRKICRLAISVFKVRGCITILNPCSPFIYIYYCFYYRFFYLMSSNGHINLINQPKAVNLFDR